MDRRDLDGLVLPTHPHHLDSPPIHINYLDSSLGDLAMDESCAKPLAISPSNPRFRDLSPDGTMSPDSDLSQSNRNSQASPSPASDPPAGITAEQQLSSLRRANLRLESSLRATREREELLRANLVRLGESKTRSEGRLARATEAKDNLDNKIQALSTLNSRLATQLHDSHARLAGLEGGRRAQEREVARLRVERGELSARLDRRRSRDSSSRVLDSDRGAKIEAVARQAEQVHAHLRAALDKVAALCSNRSPAGRDCDSPTTASLQKELGDIRFQLNLATTEQEQHRTQVETLKSKSPSTPKPQGDLNAIQEEDDLPPSPTDSIPDEAEKSRKQREFTRAKAVLARRHSATVRESLAKSQRELHRAVKRLKGLTAKLAAATEQNARQQARLARAESSLDVALHETARLAALLDRTNAGLRATEASVEEMGIEFRTFVQDSEEKARAQDVAREGLEAAKVRAESLLAAHQEDLSRAARVGTVLQRLFGGLEAGLNGSGVRPSLQDDMYSMHAALTALNDVVGQHKPDDAGHATHRSMRDSAIDVESSPFGPGSKRPSPRTSDNMSVVSSAANRASGSAAGRANHSRHSQRAGQQFVAPDGHFRRSMASHSGRTSSVDSTRSSGLSSPRSVHFFDQQQAAASAVPLPPREEPEEARSPVVIGGVPAAARRRGRGRVPPPVRSSLDPYSKVAAPRSVPLVVAVRGSSPPAAAPAAMHVMTGTTSVREIRARFTSRSESHLPLPAADDDEDEEDDDDDDDDDEPDEFESGRAAKERRMTLQEFLRAEGRQPPASHRRHSRRISQLGIGKSKVRRVSTAHLRPPGSSHQRASSGGAAPPVRRIDPAPYGAAFHSDPLGVSDEDDVVETVVQLGRRPHPSFDEADPARESLSLLPPLPLSPLADGFFPRSSVSPSPPVAEKAPRPRRSMIFGQGKRDSGFGGVDEGRMSWVGKVMGKRMGGKGK